MVDGAPPACNFKLNVIFPFLFLLSSGVANLFRLVLFSYIISAWRNISVKYEPLVLSQCQARFQDMGGRGEFSVYSYSFIFVPIVFLFFSEEGGRGEVDTKRCQHKMHVRQTCTKVVRLP